MNVKEIWNLWKEDKITRDNLIDGLLWFLDLTDSYNMAYRIVGLLAKACVNEEKYFKIMESIFTDYCSRHSFLYQRWTGGASEKFVKFICYCIEARFGREKAEMVWKGMYEQLNILYEKEKKDRTLRYLC